MENESNEKPEEILSRLNSETSKTFWIELLPFFAKGMVVHVSHNLDLIEVAYQLSKDNRKQIEDYLDNNSFHPFEGIYEQFELGHKYVMKIKNPF